MRKTYLYLVRFEVSTAVTMMIIIFWEMTPCGSFIRTDVSEDRIASIFRVYECEQAQNEVT
jgi:hypothetical protein